MEALPSLKVFPLGLDENQKNEKADEDGREDEDAFHLPVLALVALGLLQLLQPLLHAQAGVLDVEVDSVHHLTLRKSPRSVL